MHSVPWASVMWGSLKVGARSMRLIANAHKTSPAEGKMSMLPMLFISAAMLFQSTGERIWNVSKAFSGMPGTS